MFDCCDMNRLIAVVLYSKASKATAFVLAESDLWPLVIQCNGLDLITKPIPILLFAVFFLYPYFFHSSEQPYIIIIFIENVF